MKIFNSILAGASACFFCYLIGAFVGISFNIADWSDAGRALVGAVGGLAGMASFACAMEIQQ